jgi:very-short-patch-repair endonuclease
MNHNIKTPKYVIELARQMRCNLTPSEKIMWQHLRNKKLDGNRFRSQHPIHRYILDFYCPCKSLAIEIDGDIHKSRKDYDEYRDEYLRSIEIQTLRFKNSEISQNILKVISKIKNTLNQKNNL